MKRICVFCGSSAGTDPVHAEAARRLGQEIARRGLGLVYGGGHIGLMGIVADAALAGGGEVIGVIPQALADLEVAHNGLSALHVTRSMHERKAMMADLADGFIALSGGIGTFEELFEIWTWGQLGVHSKPVGLLNIAGFYDPLIAFLDSVVSSGFLSQRHRDMLVLANDPAAMLDAMAAHAPSPMGQWIERDER